MGRDNETGVLAARDGDRDRGWQATSGASAVDDLPDGAYVDGVARERLAERLLELGGPGGVEDLEEPGGRAADVVTALGDEPEERLTAASGAREPVEATMLAGASLLVDQSLEMMGVLDLLAAVPAARVGGDYVVALDDAHFVEVGKHHKRPSDSVVGDGVVVEVKADVRCLADLTFEPLVRGERLGGKR